MRKTISLPDGSTCVIRALTVMDSLRSVGFIMEPGESQAAKKPKPAATAAPDEPAKIDARELQIGLQLTRHILLNCVSPISRGPERLRIVDKDLDMIGRGEIHIEELDAETARAIVNEVLRLGGSGKEAGDAAGKFPEEQPATVDARRDRQPVRCAPEPVGGVDT